MVKEAELLAPVEVRKRIELLEPVLPAGETPVSRAAEAERQDAR